MPAVSIIFIGISLINKLTSITSLVVPGILVTIAFSFFASKFNKEDINIIKEIPKEKLITILGNKKDLIDSKNINSNELKNTILMSIKKNDGERLLIDKIIKKCGLKQLENINIFLKERHLTNLSACLSNLNDTDEIIKNKLPFDLLSIELRDGIQNLSKITGQELTEELLDNIFSKFCIGK